MSTALDTLFAAFDSSDAATKQDMISLLKQAGVLDGSYPQSIPDAGQPPPPQLMLIDPENIRTDAATYQFRLGGDGSGVTKARHFEASRWDPILHGDPLMVHERLDGRLFVADGHHRLDLAKRLNAEGSGPGKVAALVLREADGYTPHDVKIIAAYKNIARGQTDPVEAALVFKEAPDIEHPQWLPPLQMDKGNLNLSLTLARLPKTMLHSVSKGEVSLPMATVVADRIPDYDVHMRVNGQPVPRNAPRAPRYEIPTPVEQPSAAMALVDGDMMKHVARLRQRAGVSTEAMAR